MIGERRLQGLLERVESSFFRRRRGASSGGNSEHSRLDDTARASPPPLFVGGATPERRLARDFRGGRRPAERAATPPASAFPLHLRADRPLPSLCSSPLRSTRPGCYKRLCRYGLTRRARLSRIWTFGLWNSLPVEAVRQAANRLLGRDHFQFESFPKCLQIPWASVRVGYRTVTAHLTSGRGAELDEEVRMRPPPEGGGGLDLRARGARLDCPFPLGEKGPFWPWTSGPYCPSCISAFCQP